MAGFERQHGSQRHRQSDLFLAPLGEQVGPPAQVLGGLAVAGDIGDRVSGDGASDPQRDALAGLLEELLQQESHAQARMN